MNIFMNFLHSIVILLLQRMVWWFTQAAIVYECIHFITAMFTD